jgi:chromosome segregation ATPase
MPCIIVSPSVIKLSLLNNIIDIESCALVERLLSELLKMTEAYKRS